MVVADVSLLEVSNHIHNVIITVCADLHLIDPNQLPPTVLSAQAIELNYARSLFERMQKLQPNSVRLLT
jgi:hypothetical protein